MSLNRMAGNETRRSRPVMVEEEVAQVDATRKAETSCDRDEPMRRGLQTFSQAEAEVET